jgi:hypothetical protein
MNFKTKLFCYINLEICIKIHEYIYFLCYKFEIATLWAHTIKKIFNNKIKDWLFFCF